ncbi:hypothetical protein SCHPADRAFT_934890 [Schizopora paradoxa]|uniref:NACHT domain-containing protein n=1 Tax=Schizopora paradoxa TaxID=27342 RepID=A0A0H2S6Z4_9AGAM|nr:hypothetical protein SCHPADRAFT_934890 [Schizopora paradoxa]
MKSLRKLFRCGPRQVANSKKAGMKRGTTAIEEEGSQTMIGRTEAQKQDDENRIVAEGLIHREESFDVAKMPPAVRPVDGSDYRVQGERLSIAGGRFQSNSKRQEEFLEVVKMSLTAGETITSALPFPGSDIVFSVLGGIVERVQTTKDNKEAKDVLLERLRHLQTLLPQDDPSHWPEESLSALRAFKSKIIEQLQECVDSSKSRSNVTKYIFANLDKGKLSALDECVARAVGNFQTGLLVGGVNTDARIERGVHNLDEKVDAQFDAQTQLLFEQALREVVGRLPQLATYDSSRTRELIPCHPGTCEVILKEIKAWATAEIEERQHRVLWLCGRAGTGKSTIATTIATWADKVEHFLGSNYFFSRDVEGLSSCSHVIPTVAYHLSEHLSEHNPSFTEAVRSRLVAKNGHVLNQKIEEQFENLIEGPLRLAYAPGVPRERTLLVIDGLDECDDQRKLKDTISLLLSLLSPTNAHIRILLVSRPENYIEDALSLENGLHPHVVRHNLEDFVTTSDIEEYLRLELSKIGKADWPSINDFNSLVNSCGQLFVYASTVIHFIREETAIRNHRKSLQILLSVKSSEGHGAASAYKRLNELYLQILRTAVGESDEADPEAMVQFRNVLGTIALSRIPLSVISIAHLIGVEEEEIWTVLEFLRSIIIVPSQASRNREEPPRFYHPSLREFLTDAKRCNDERFYIGAPHMEAYLFQRCVDIVIKGSTGIVAEDLIPVMRYVCQYWGHHLEKVHDETALVATKLDEFVKHHLLRWFRSARILLRLCDPLFRCMEVARNWALATKSNYSSELSKNLGTMLQSSRVLNDGLSEVYEPTYDAARSQCGDVETRRATCHPETRKAVLDEIKDWARSESTGPRILWLHGSALSGKSAVAMSIAEWADEKGKLCGGLFFRDVIETSELRRVICTISHDLASFNVAMRGLVLEALERNEGLRYSEDAELQFDALIAKPLLSMKQDSSEGPILLIIDGLEWCGGAAQLLALFFTRLSGPGGSHIRILFTSRASPHILKTFEEFKGLHRSFNLDEVPAEVVRQDIENYLHDGLRRVHEMLGLSTPRDWLSRTDLDSLVDDSRNSFLYAKYALRFIGNPSARNPEEQLQNWLLKSFDGESFKDIYPHWVAELAIGAPPVSSHVGLLFVAICISKEPLPLASLAELLQTDTDILRTTLPHLHPFIVSDADDDFRPSHSSLRDFCMDSELLPGQHAAGVCYHCLRIMNQGLNIVFEDPNRTNKKEDKRNAVFRPALRYACRYWATIISKAIRRWENGNLSRHFDTFIQKHLLSWIYAMYLLQLASELDSMMRTAYEWSQDNLHASDQLLF